MTISTKTPAARLREAVAMVRGNPTAVAQIDADEKHLREQAAAEAKKRTDAMAKVEKELPARVEAIIEDYVAREQDALRLAAESVARAQLELQYGITPIEALAFAPVPQRVGSTVLDRFRKRLFDTAPLPWAKGLSAAQNASVQARESAATRAPVVDDVPARIAERERMLYEQRQAANAARKRAAGI